jgi:EF hand domain-containing protein
MSYRNGFFFAFSAVLALGAASAQAQGTYRKTDPYNNGRSDDRMYKSDIYADDDFWYGGDDYRGLNSRFRGMDRNRDGVITRTEWRGNANAFRNQDWNDDGVLSGREVRANASRDRARSRVEAVDENRDGAISRREWRGSRADFNRIDRNDDGIISGAEARMRYYFR